MNTLANRPDLLCTEGLINSGVVDYVWNNGWRPATSESLQRAQHSIPDPLDRADPDGAVVSCFRVHYPDVLEHIRRSAGRFIVIVRDGDGSVDDSRLPDNVHHVFASSALCSSSRLTPMPMAFHAFWGAAESVHNLLAENLPRARTNRVLLSHSMDTGSVYTPAHERVKSIRYFEDKPWATVNPDLVRWVPGHFHHASWPWPDYARKLLEHDYIAVPVGYGVERIMQWEAMLLGTIPICIRHPELMHFDDMPIAFVNNWEEVTPEWCDANLGIIGRSTEKLKLSYWVEQIRHKRAENGI